MLICTKTTSTLQVKHQSSIESETFAKMIFVNAQLALPSIRRPYAPRKNSNGASRSSILSLLQSMLVLECRTSEDDSARSASSLPSPATANHSGIAHLKYTTCCQPNFHELHASNPTPSYCDRTSPYEVCRWCQARRSCGGSCDLACRQDERNMLECR